MNRESGKKEENIRPDVSDDYLKGYADGVSDGSTGLVNFKKFEKGEELNERKSPGDLGDALLGDVTHGKRRFGEGTFNKLCDKEAKG